jgi:hypothetical protein
MTKAWNDTVDLLKWLKVAAPQDIYDEASQTADIQAAFNMCDHLITELERENRLHIYARFLKARLFVKLNSKSHAVEELNRGLTFADRTGMSSDDPQMLAANELLTKLMPKKKPKPVPAIPADMSGILAAMHKLCRGFSPPCTPEQIRQLHSKFDGIQSEVEQIYKDHNGCKDLPSLRRGELSLAAAAVPVECIAETQSRLSESLKRQSVGMSDHIAWLWFDGGGNYAGIFLSGADKGSITKYFHEDPVIRPAYRSVYDFVAKVLECGYMSDEPERPCDIQMLPETIAGV